MGFRRGNSQQKTWLRFCGKHAQLLAETGLPPALAHSVHHFRNLLHDGQVEVNEVNISLANLSDEQWYALEKFATVFFDAYESYAPLDIFLAFRQEVQRRGSKFLA
jgi:hypothetical protein